MPLPGKRPPYGFVCPHRNYCPHLEGLSTHWVWAEYQRSGQREDDDAQRIHQLGEDLAQAGQRIFALERENDELKAKLAALHKSRFKRQRKVPSDQAQGHTLGAAEPAKSPCTISYPRVAAIWPHSSLATISPAFSILTPMPDTTPPTPSTGKHASDT